MTSTPVTQIHPNLLRSQHTPPTRTLVDILDTTAANHPTAIALDTPGGQLTYTEFLAAADALAADLAGLGIGRGARVGVRVPSGTADLYVAIAGILRAGAAYVPVDVDDPDERARTVFAEANVAAVIGEHLTITARHGHEPDVIRPIDPPTPDDAAWIIFTSGSTGTPKGVNVTHRSAAAFVDAESRLFLQGAPLGPGDRVLAGLSVAFDASCEEMWLAWRYGATLVPAPRSLVRSGVELGPWLLEQRITVVSTVPTLVLMWPPEALREIRLLILGGEACPPEIGNRFATDTCEVWNTYGPTEATVVACAAQVYPNTEVTIGLPLDGWDLAVVDPAGQVVPEGESGELIIGGVGLAEYLDPAIDAVKYAAMPTLGWERAYRSGDLVVNDPTGLRFLGRADDQVKIGGRRIELGELDAAVLEVPGVTAAAVAVQKTTTGTQLLIGYVTVDDMYSASEAKALLRERLPASLVPRLVTLDALPTRTSGKIDRNALPWPITLESDATDKATFTNKQQRMADVWESVLGFAPADADENFFDIGGTSLSAAKCVAVLRETYPNLKVADLYDNPTVAELTRYVTKTNPKKGQPHYQTNTERTVPVSRASQFAQALLFGATRSLTAARWFTYAALIGHALNWAIPRLTQWAVPPVTALPPLAPIMIAALLLIVPVGRLVLAAALIRLTLIGIRPGTYRRAGSAHLRLWAAERISEELRAMTSGTAPMVRWYARMLGAKVGVDIDLHAAPPVTGFLELRDRCCVEPEVDLNGYWIDGNDVHVGRIIIGSDARVGARSTIMPDTHISEGTEVAAGSTVSGMTPPRRRISGSPARVIGKSHLAQTDRPDSRKIWQLAYGVTGTLMNIVPGVALALTTLAAASLARIWPTPTQAAIALVAALPALVLLYGVLVAAQILLLVRTLAIGLTAGEHPIHGRQAWQAWSTLRLMDEARSWLYPLYSSLATPTWLRLLGARVGSHVEISTALMIPKFVHVARGAFLADDTLVGGYELRAGQLRLDRVKVGRNAFIGNSGMAAPGRRVPKHGLVAVLSAAPKSAKGQRGTSWIGSPPEPLQRNATDVDAATTFDPPRWAVWCRALMECARVIPATGAALTGASILVVLGWVAVRWTWWIAALAAPLVVITIGAASAILAALAARILTGRLRHRSHPLWSWFVWRNELADNFTELMAAPWWARPAIGTLLMNWWWRLMGARIGRGVWCETYWLPEAGLVELADGATVNRGCVVQTHLFHDRLLSLDDVVLGVGSTLGPNSVILPAAELHPQSTVGPGSLVMRGEVVPEGSRWQGNPIAPWQMRSTNAQGDTGV